jgi:hypothetical protein
MPSSNGGCFFVRIRIYRMSVFGGFWILSESGCPGFKDSQDGVFSMGILIFRMCGFTVYRTW